MHHLTPDRPIPLEHLLELYASVGWTAYTREPERLERAFDGSTYVVGAWEADELIGVCRVLSDDASIIYVQDILVDPDHQRRGIGRELLKHVLNRYSHCRQKVLMTDDRPEQKAFYEALGFTRLDLREGPALRAFVKLGD